jgi:D-tyrosyl-tRNA(Tyr) deacylase
MVALLQRVRSAAVDIAGERFAEIGPGLLVLLGVGHDDNEARAAALAKKTAALRIFSDEAEDEPERR